MLFVISTVQRIQLPPPMVEPLHWLTDVTGSVRVVVLVEQRASGAPAAPWHSRTVTVADPPPAVIVFTIVTSQISPRPPVLSMPLLQVVVGPMAVAAKTGGVVPRGPAVSRAIASTPDRTKASGRRMSTPVRVERRCRQSQLRQPVP
jgi:hypothetical protein